MLLFAILIIGVLGYDRISAEFDLWVFGRRQRRLDLLDVVDEARTQVRFLNVVGGWVDLPRDVATDIVEQAGLMNAAMAFDRERAAAGHAQTLLDLLDPYCVRDIVDRVAMSERAERPHTDMA